MAHDQMVDQELPPRTWNFWLPDNDRSNGWTNHGYSLQFVTKGEGRNPEEAWEDVLRRGHVPEGFHLPERLTAIPDDQEVGFNADPERLYLVVGLYLDPEAADSDGHPQRFAHSVMAVSPADAERKIAEDPDFDESLEIAGVVVEGGDGIEVVA